MNYWQAELHLDQLDDPDFDYNLNREEGDCDDTDGYAVEIDEPDDSVDEYLSTKDVEDIVDSILMDIYEDILFDEDGVTAAGYALLGEMDERGDFV
jgi:hypothetical protein